MKTAGAIRSQNGGVLIELAIILLLVITLGVGLGEFGLVAYNKQVLNNAAREGVRTGIVRWTHPEPPDGDGSPFTEEEVKAKIQQTVENYYSGRLISFGEYAPPSIDYEPDTIDFTFGADLKVIVNYQYEFLAPSLVGLGLTMPLRGETLMQMEQLL
jgi:hypothetical protein